MTRNFWHYGPNNDFWAEHNPPQGSTWMYTFDDHEIIRETRNLLYLLHLLKVVECDYVYEGLDGIRICGNR
jgi:hypothetical protein